jgi:hypothetical protein
MASAHPFDLSDRCLRGVNRAGSSMSALTNQRGLQHKEKGPEEIPGLRHFG